MMLKKCMLCVALLLIVGRTSSCETRDSLKLELVQIVFRHGERTPQVDELKLIPNATAAMAEPWGFSQLTNNGKRQEYNIGKQLRKSYDKFLGDTYKPDEVYATSSDYDRTKASLELVLAAIYPPTDELLWNESLKWAPIPINFLPRALDHLFMLFSCFKHTERWKRIIESDEVREHMKQNDDLINHLKSYFPTTELDLKQFFYLHNIIVIQKSLNKTNPAWYNETIHERVRLMSKFYLDTLSYTDELSRLNGGSLVRRMLDNMDIYDRDRNDRRKFYLYSGHEFTVYAVAKSHNITLDLSPTYGSAFILEKLRDERNRIYVKISYWDGTAEELTVLKLNGCGKICPIDKYLKIVWPHLSSDEDMRCLIENLTTDDLERILNSKKTGISA